MQAIASFTFDCEYYNVFYNDWLAHRSRWRRYAIPFAGTLTIVAAASLILLPDHHHAAIAFVVLAVLNLADVATHKVRWIRKRTATVPDDKHAEFVFADDGIHVSTPNSDGNLKYAALQSFTVTPNGLFMAPGSGLSIYVPRPAFASPDDFDTVSKRLDDAIASR